MIPAEVLDALVAAGATPDMIVAAIRADQAIEDRNAAEKRAKNAQRVRNWRARCNAHSTAQTSTAEHERAQPSSPASSPSPSPPITPLTLTPSSPPSPSRTVAVATRPIFDPDFTEFWRLYPKREGANPRAPARKAFIAALKAGTEVPAIIAGVQRFAVRDRDKIGTPYIPQAVNWLKQRRWEDYGDAAQTGPPASGWKPGLPTADELAAKYGATNGEGNATARAGVEQDPPVVQDRARSRDDEPELVRREVPIARVQRMGELFRTTGLGSTGVQASGGGEAVHSTMPMARVADG